jgi:hypothetical protein
MIESVVVRVVRNQFTGEVKMIDNKADVTPLDTPPWELLGTVQLQILTP